MPRFAIMDTKFLQLATLYSNYKIKSADRLFNDLHVLFLLMPYFILYTC